MRHDLIEACKRFDRKAQWTLYHDYADAMYNVAFRMVRDEEEAQDVLQNAFADIFRNLRKFKYESTPGAWIKRIVVNKALTLIKSKKKQNIVPLEEDHTMIYETGQEIDSEFDIEKIKKAIDLLPDGYRTVLTLYLIEGFDHKEIAQILSISEATSKSQYSRAKSKLRMTYSNMI